MADRGGYRSVKVVLLDGPDFQELPERENHVFVFLKLSFGPSGIEVHYPEALAHLISARTRIPVDAVRGCLDTLDALGWIRRQGNVVWLVGQLEHDPHQKWDDEKHRKGIWKHLAGLPRLPIVGQFIDAHPDWFEARAAVTAKNEPKQLAAAPDSILSLRALASQGPSKPLARPFEAANSEKVEARSDNNHGAGSNVEKSEAEYSKPPEFTRAQLLDAAKRECGMNTWTTRQEGSAASVLTTFYGAGRSPGDIWGAIHGARILSNAGKVGWLPPQRPFELKALLGTFTLADQGDGKSVRPFFDVALEEYIRAGTGPPTRGANTGPVPIADLLRIPDPKNQQASA